MTSQSGQRSRTRPWPRRGLAALLAVATVALGGAGCDDEPEAAEDPPLRVPGVEVPEPPAPPPGMPAGMALTATEAPTFTTPLAVPGHATIPDRPAPPVPTGMQPAGAPIPLAPGFQPDPFVQRGMAGGPVQAAATVPPAAQAGCPGYVAPQPNHVVQLTAPFARFRIVVSAAVDTVLVVRAPDGTVLCHDDVDMGNGNHNPLIEGAFSPGPYSIFVGTYDQGQSGPYAIGFTELPQVSAQTLAQAAPPPGAVPPGQAPPMMPQPQ